MKKKRVTKLLGATLALAIGCVTAFSNVGVVKVMGKELSESEKVELSDDEIKSLLDEKNYSFTRDSVHDPSVIDGRNGYYYVFGSHAAVSKTNDFMNWTNVCTDNKADSTLFGKVGSDGKVSAVSFDEAFNNNETKEVTVLVDGKETKVDFGNFDAEAWNTARDNFTVNGNMWAPDVIYNDTMNKWCMYLSLNGSKWNSSIILLTADDVEGPYVYQGPVMYSGFSTTKEALSYKNTDLELAIGDLEALPEKYDKADSSQWGEYWPHAIDPCVFYDEEGKLWLAYGSWSGGIYVIELDETTGLRDYTVKYDSDFEEKGKSVTTDEYFGKKIAGGHYVSGEGSYIQHIGDYYYLFMSYGFYSPEGGYNMRIFRSETPDGNYVDTTGQDAKYTSFALNYNADWGTIKDYRGDRLMTNYQWDSMDTPEVSQGHNSAMVDEEGRAYVVYHTKFDNGTVGHELRVHELFTNKNGWIVASPYEFTNDEKLSYNKGYSSEDLAGDYQLIVHSYEIGYDNSQKNNIAVVTPVDITLEEDNTVSGAFTGTWSCESGSPYATITLDGKEYHGVFAKQTVDATGVKSMCFTAVDESTGLNIWGSRQMDDAKAVAINADSNAIKLPEQTYKNIELPTAGQYGVSISWKSDNKDVLSNEGVIGTVKEATVVKLTATYSKGKYFYDKEFMVEVLPPYEKSENGKELNLTKDEVNITSNDQIEYIDNPFYGEDVEELSIKYTINFADNSAKNGWDGIFAFFNSKTQGRISMQTAPYVCYNEATGNWIDINGAGNSSTNKTGSMKAGTDYTFDIKISPQDVQILMDGKQIDCVSNGSGAALTDLLSYVGECDQFTWGVGLAKSSYWNTELCTLKNVEIKAYVKDGDKETTEELDKDESGLTLPKKITNKKGEKFNGQLKVGSLAEEIKMMDAVILVDKKLDITDVKVDENLVGGEINWYVENGEDVNKLRFVYADLTKNQTITTTADMPYAPFSIGFELAETVKEAEKLKISVESFNQYTSSEEKIPYKLNTQDYNVEIVPESEISIAASKLFVGDGSDLIKEGDTAYKIVFTGLEKEPSSISFMNGEEDKISVYSSKDFTDRDSVNTYLLVVSEDVNVEDIENIENYIIEEKDESIEEIIFGDTNGDEIIDAQDALKQVRTWLRKDNTEMTDKNELTYNVNGDSAINTLDALATVEHFIADKQWAIVSKN